MLTKDTTCYLAELGIGIFNQHNLGTLWVMDGSGVGLCWLSALCGVSTLGFDAAPVFVVRRGLQFPYQPAMVYLYIAVHK
jgi:hypothetical protein